MLNTSTFARIYRTATLTNESKLGGWGPLFLRDRPWAMQSVEYQDDPITGQPALERIKEGLTDASLVILRDDGARLWYLPGLTSPAKFLEYFGLTVTTPKGIGPLMKRLSRMLVQFQIGGWFKGTDITIRYLRLGAVRTQAYDGSIKVSRAFVLTNAKNRIEEDFAPRIQELRAKLLSGVFTGDEYARLKQERETLSIQAAEIWRAARAIQEGEFTLIIGEGVTSALEPGFYKGQATVVDTDEYEILLPRGAAKPEIVMSGDRLFFGIKPISAHDHMFLDRQSLTNLNTPQVKGELGFFSHDPDAPGRDRLVRWLEAHLTEYKLKVDSGHFSDTITRQIGYLRWEVQSDKFLNYYLNHYVARGGDVRWFRRTLSQAYHVGLEPIAKRFNETSYPIPGLRLYVRPSSMANKHVGRGEVAWDLKRGVIYVNDVDAVTFDPRWKDVNQLEQWLASGHTLSELPTGLQARLGGHDNDDAFQVVPFIDFDGVKRVYVWRSPNTPGERHLFVYKGGEVPEDRGFWFKGDSRRMKEFSALVIDEKYAIKPHLPKLDGYTLANIMKVATLIQQNAAAVGMFCLSMRNYVLIIGDVPLKVACTAEAIIDGATKALDDVSGPMRWTRDLAQALTLAGHPVPQLIYNEFVRFLPEEWAEQGKLPKMLKANTHWIDRLTSGAEAVIEAYKASTLESSNLAVPPGALFERGMGWAAPGVAVRSAYGHSMYLSSQGMQAVAERVVDEGPYDDEDMGQEVSEVNWGALNEKQQFELMFDLAREATVTALGAFPQEQWPLVMVGGLAATYMEHLAMRSDFPELGQTEGADAGPIRDNWGFQMGKSRGPNLGREPGLDLITLEGLAQLGILKDLQWTADRRLIVQPARDVHPLAAMTMLKVAHGWFNYGINVGKLPANAPMRGLSQNQPLLVAELKKRFEAYDLTGKHLTAEMRSVQIGAKMVEKPVLVGTSGKMLGIISGKPNMATLPPQLVVVNAHTANDNTWLMLRAA